MGPEPVLTNSYALYISFLVLRQTRHMKKLLIPVLAIIFFSCANHDTGKKNHTTNSQEDPDGDDDASAEELEGSPVAPEIGRNTLHPGKLVVNGTFEADSVLKQIFPGIYNDTEGPNGIWWTCAQCPRTEIVYHYFTEPEKMGWFPDSNFNTTATWADDTLYLGEKTYRLLTFFHTNQPEIEFVSRFEGAPTGVALFKQEGNKYILENFDPMLGSYGSFKTPVAPGYHRVGKNIFLLNFNYGNGGPGARYTDVAELFLPLKGGFKKVLFERYLSCSNTDMGEWETKITAADTLNESGPCDLIFTTTGWANGASMDQEEGDDDMYYFRNLSPEIELKAIQAKNSKAKFYFRLVRTYHYNGKEYTCMDKKTLFSEKALD